MGEQIPLTGGRITPEIFRVGNTVHRRRSPDFMTALLRHLEEVGFEGAPRYLGRDGELDILTYLPGEVPARFRPWSTDQLQAAAELLRRLHDATSGSSLAGRFEVVCHHDPGPNNAVFRDGMPTAFIDFTDAAPGGRLEDVGYLAWTWAVSSKVPVEEQAAQVRIVADAYGLDGAGRSVLVDCILERQLRNVRFWGANRAAASPEAVAERIEWSRREHGFVHAHRRVFERALD